MLGFSLDMFLTSFLNLNDYISINVWASLRLIYLIYALSILLSCLFHVCLSGLQVSGPLETSLLPHHQNFKKPMLSFSLLLPVNL